MISWKRQIIRDGIDIRGGIPPIPVILAFLIWQAWQCRQLGWHRGMIARVIVPDRKATHLLVKRIPQGQIQLMAVVKLVVIPILIEVIILSLVPRERIRTTQSQMIGAISGISLNAIEEPLAIHHLRIPMLSRRLYAYPTAVLKQMLGQLIIPFERQKPMAVGLGIDSCRKLIRTHWLQISGSRYPIIRRQGQVAVRDLMHILGHLSKGSLQRHLIAQLIFQGKTWVDIQEVLITDMKKAHIEANIHTPVAVDIDFILCVCRPLMRHMTITTIHSDGINLG